MLGVIGIRMLRDLLSLPIDHKPQVRLCDISPDASVKRTGCV